MKALALVAVAMMLVVPAALADCSFNYGWEDGYTYLTIYQPDYAYGYNVGAPDPVHTGLRSLKLVDNTDPLRATPDVYICWIVGLTDGDQVTASIWRYDTTPGGSPSARIWAKYTPVGGDVDSYAGSASGNSDYGPGTGWDQTSYTWTFDSNSDARDGLGIAIRTYSNAGDTVWVDDLEVFIDSDTFCGQVYLPCNPVPVEAASWAQVKALYR